MDKNFSKYLKYKNKYLNTRYTKTNMHGGDFDSRDITIIKKELNDLYGTDYGYQGFIKKEYTENGKKMCQLVPSFTIETGMGLEMPNSIKKHTTPYEC